MRLMAGVLASKISLLLCQLRRLSSQRPPLLQSAPAPAARQVSAHGTGAAIPPVDEQVVALKLVTPALGTIELSKVTAPQASKPTALLGLGWGLRRSRCKETAQRGAKLLPPLRASTHACPPLAEPGP
jgi:hypothetical protein